MGEWFNRQLLRVAGAIVAIVILGFLLRLAYDLISPAIPVVVGLVVFALIVVFAIQRHRGW